MNTRLQVEHPVTELITGVDLVEQMIRSAYGEKLAIKQKDIKLNGWAIESRVYAEDPYRGFLPSTGRLTKYRPPAESHDKETGITVRNDTGVYEGGEISIYYDPMIAKLCSHAADRSTAIAAMSRALDAFYIDGIQHNIPFVSAIMAHPRWQSGELATSFITDEFPDGFHGADLSDDVRFNIATVAVVCDHVLNRRKREISGQMGGRPVQFSSRRSVQVDDDWVEAEILGCEGKLFRLTVADKDAAVECQWSPGEPVWHGRINGDPVSVQVRPVMNGFRMSHGGSEVNAHVYTAREAELVKLMPVKLPPDTSKQLLCPMPGLVVSIDVKEGQQVKAGEKLAVVEAMKMENILRAERDGTVQAIHAEPGANLAVDAIIMEFE